MSADIEMETVNEIKPELKTESNEEEHANGNGTENETEAVEVKEEGMDSSQQVIRI